MVLITIPKNIIDEIGSRDDWEKKDCSDKLYKKMSADVCFKKKTFGFLYLRLSDDENYFLYNC